MKKSKYESLWESPKHDKTFSDAIGVSLDLLIDTTDDQISCQSTRLGVKIFKAIMNVRKSFLMKEKLKELDLKEIKEEEDEMSEDDIQNESIGIDHQQMSEEEEEISEDGIQNESMGIDHQQVSETLEKHKKSSVIEISESESDVTEMNDDQMSNNSTYSLGYDEEVEEYSTMDENQMLLSNDNNKLKCTSSAVILSEQNIQQVDTGGVKRKLMDNDSNLLTTQNKRLCVVETSINQQSGPSSTSAPKNYALKEKTLYKSLHNEQNAWKPTARLQINDITPDYETKALYKKVQCILNQLTAENMDKLTQEVKDLNINTRERLQGVVNLIFDKAINEPNSTAIYTVMCKKLADMQVDMKQENEKSFHILLLAHCRHEFKNTTIDKYARDAKLKEIRKCNDIEKKKKLISSLIDADRPLTGKAVGNIRFIGELFKQDMLKTSIIDRYIKDLLTPVDYNIECLCKLLTTIGAKLEKSMNNNFDYYFNRMSSLASNEKLSSRVRYMLQEVIDLRANYWEPKRDKNNTIKHINEERAPSKKDDKNIEGVLKMKATNNDSSLPTEINKQPYAIATSTPNQQTPIQLPGYSCSYSYRNFY
ncbi:eukaryotic translation initiation factor 4 gamma 3-like [Aphidius gifuensis]|uniref:eukaryotic translation initiation factor 4 gamma 3-like n=1 Tax=Aphidius gifuensis TaxID=684658 RepID=UPI001CDC2119|nr:eukaryotic translation initiation factor 4 gamma 3-like [Aphidius gifuensis]